MARDELQDLPGIGPSLAIDLRQLGVTSVKSLARRNPERMYARLCDLTRSKQDPCVLYVFRCAVYASRTAQPNTDLLKWWSWMERRFDSRGRIVKTAKGVPAKYRRQKQGQGLGSIGGSWIRRMGRITTGTTTTTATTG